MAIVWAIKKFRNYIHGTEFIIEADHNSLEYLDKEKFINPKIMSWSMILQQCRFMIRALKGSQNHAADYHSRVGMIQDKLSRQQCAITSDVTIAMFYVGYNL